MKFGSGGWRRLVAIVCGVGVVLTGALVGGPQATADPLSDAKEKLAQLAKETAAIEESYNNAQKQLDDARQQQTQLATDIADTVARIETLKPGIVWIVTMQRQGGDISMTASFLLNDSPDMFLSQMATAASVTTMIDEQMSQFVAEKQKLTNLDEAMATTLATIESAVATQQQLLKEAKAKQAAEQQLVDRLTRAQQAALAATPAGWVPSASDASASDRARTALAYALQQVGKPYVLGGSGPDVFDCSGLVMTAYKLVGVSLPHNARTQANYGTPVDPANLAPGDLIFFYHPIHHVAIYIGNGLIVHASTPATGVKISGITWANYNTARRMA